MAITPTYNRLAGDPLAMFDQIFGNTGTPRRAASLMRAPETDVVETEREIRVQVEMPGLKRENIEVDVENNVLTIRGEKREERTEGQEGRYHLAERRWGTFARSFVLPRDVDADNIQASFEDGVLTVSIPKSEKARRRKIDVGGNVNAQQVGTGAQGENGNGEQQNNG
ncbi:MAG: Hsp20/alpha crystallin family protein [Longimicrobiaceae bacterium]